jgi:ethanolamine utilization protein EutN
MRFARVTGTVVSTAKLDSFTGEKLLLIQPLDENGKDNGREIVACDTVQAGPGDLVFFETGREAAIALENTWNVSDATIMAIVDSIHNEGAGR